MRREHFPELLSELMGISLSRYCRHTGILTVFDSEGGWNREISREDEDFLQRYLRLQKEDYPVIRLCGSRKELLFVLIPDGKQPESWYLAGPVLVESAGGDSLQKACEKYREFAALGLPIRMCKRNRLTSGVALLYWYVSGSFMNIEEFWRRNRSEYCDMQKVWERMELDIFRRQEQYGPHNPYEQEQRELESIRTGDVKALNDSIAETYTGTLGILAKDPLRHHKNIAIGNITLASRMAISGGVGTEYSFSMADSFIQQIEELDNVPGVVMLKREAQRAFAEAVKMERPAKTEENFENPLIAGVKDYIFSHLHDSIRVSDIAKSLNVNADYLSHLFRSRENITIKQYIHKEKINRSRNLLRYSDASIHEIAFYLGFSSQSHFTSVFQKIAGETPNDYRKKFLDRRSWKIWDQMHG